MIFLEAEDLQRAKDFAASADLPEVMQAGWSNGSTGYLLSPIEANKRVAGR
jgi:hypothetical protein